MDILSHLRYFQEVCKYKNITKASNAIHVSQPTVTTAIKDLEKELGFDLFVRSKGKIFLTPEGQRFLVMLEDQLASFDDFYKRSKELAQNKTRTLTLGISPILNLYFYENKLMKFTEQNPEVHLIIAETPTYIGVQKVDDSMLDLFIGAIDEDKHSCNVKPIFETKLVFWAGENHPLAKEDVITPQMLEQQPFIMPHEGSWHFKAISQQYKNVPLNIIMHSNQLSTIYHILKQGMAVTILFEKAFKVEDGLCKKPLVEPLQARIGALWNKDRYVSDVMASFLRFLESD